MSHQRQCRRIYLLKWTIAIGSLFLLQLQALDTSAQVLNQKINDLLADNCVGLGTGGPPVPNLAGLGSNLATLCFPLQQKPPDSIQGAATSGGGAASVQGSAASILNRTLLGRLEELKNEERGNSEQPSSMHFNPFGLMSMTQVGSMNVSSPFYAATTAGGGSTASFTTSSPSRWKGLGFFASGLVESLNRDITTFQNGYKSTILGFAWGWITVSVKA